MLKAETRSRKYPILDSGTLTPLQDLLTGDEIISDTAKIIDAGNGLWEVDGKMVKKGAENFGTRITQTTKEQLR